MTATHTTAERLVASDATSDQRTYSMLMHLSMLVPLLTAGPGIVVPLIMWLIKKGDSAFVDDHGREALNFQISMIIYGWGAAVLAAFTCGLSLVMLLPILVLSVVGMILAAIAANRGEYYRYPATIRFLH